MWGPDDGLGGLCWAPAVGPCAWAEYIGVPHLTCIVHVWDCKVEGAEQPVSSRGIWFKVLHGLIRGDREKRIGHDVNRGPHCSVHNRPTADGGWANMAYIHTQVDMSMPDITYIQYIVCHAACRNSEPAIEQDSPWSLSQLDVFIGIRAWTLSMLWS